MNKAIFLAALYTSVNCCTVYAQEENIVQIIDELTLQWDTEAVNLETHDGFQNYCRNRAYRDNTILLLNKIHHYDTSLYFIVTEKFNKEEDLEARATLEDIETLEIDYTTSSFMTFLREECMKFNDLEMNKSSEDYEVQMNELEAELAKYIDAITRRIDLVDEHVHHLKGL